MTLSICATRMFILCMLSCFICSLGQEQYLDGTTLETLQETERDSSVVPRTAERLQEILNDFVSESFNLFQLNTREMNLVSDTDLNNTRTICGRDLNHFLSNLETLWGAQMLDSYGKITPGVLRGSIIWSGQYTECMAVYAPLDNEGLGGFYGKYCVATWNLFDGKNHYFPRMGLCVPDSCSGENVEDLLIGLMEEETIFDALPFLENIQSSITLNSVECKARERQIDTPSIVYLCVASIPIILTVLGSLLSLSMNSKLSSGSKKKLLCTKEAEDNGHLSHEKIIETNGKTSETKDKDSTRSENGFEPLKHNIRQAPQTVSTIKKILLCFSIFTNGEKILNIEKSQGQLMSLHGIRLISLIWIITGHGYMDALSTVANLKDCLEGMDTLADQLVFQGLLAVDTFLVLSGFLLGYLFLKEVEKSGKINWIHFYLIRIWRLTPPYLFFLFFYMLIFKHIGFGPFWNDNRCDAARDQWWKYSLYIHNFIPFKDMCSQWLWYLALDWQMYFISPLFLYPLWKFPKTGFAILGSIVVTSWAVTGIITYSYDLMPSLASTPLAEDYLGYYIRVNDMLDIVYDKPYCRIAPYIIGIMLGYIYHKLGGRKHFLARWQTLLGWTIALLFVFSVTFGLYHNEPGRIGAALYSAFARTVFAIGVAWIIFACETGHGGFISKFLSWKVFIPLSRLTFCTYLIHPVVLHYYYGTLLAPLNFTRLMMNFLVMNYIITSFGLAFVYSCIFESPFMNLQKLLLKRKEE